VRRHELELTMTLRQDELHALVAMGPSAHHLDSHLLAERIAKLPRSVRVCASVAIETFRANPAAAPSA
jgi:23S rRNA (guanine745-N1)-methyltransferase